MMTLKQLIAMAKTYGEDTELFFETQEGEIIELCKITTAEIAGAKPVHSENGLVLRGEVKL